MNRAHRTLVSLICVFTFTLHIMPTAAYGQDINSALKKGVVTNVKKGEAAPFTGILLSTDAAAKLYGDLNFFEKECQLFLSKELDIAKIKYNAEIDSLRLKLTVETERTEKLLQIKDERIQFLEKNWRSPAWYESGEFWLAIGVISGIALTIGAGYAVGQANK